MTARIRANPKILCLVWAPFSPRMDELASDLNGERANLTFAFGPRYLAPIRYLVLSVRTGLLLLRKRPHVVYAQNPAIFCPLACMPYCKLWKCKLIIDHHAVWSTKTLGSGVIGKTIRRFERFCSSRANVNTTPHPEWTRELHELGARNVFTIYDYVQPSGFERSNEVRSSYLIGRKYLLLAPHGGHPLERIENEIDALSSFQDSTELLISGPTGKLAKRLESVQMPANVRYLGFTEKQTFLQILASADVGLSITDEPYTVSHSLLEFAVSRVPVISSNQSVVRELFGDSLVYVESSEPKAISSALRRLLENPDLLADYRQRLGEKQQEFKAKRELAVAELRKLLGD
jgi:glycosyltransferase involved in cell wall biosynthesis